MTKRVDENWKQLQQTTFTRYINSSLRGPDQKTSDSQITDLQTDLQDGLILIKLLESIASPKKIGRYNKRPFIKAQKLENLGACFRFFERQKIKLVNIGTVMLYSLLCTINTWYTHKYATVVLASYVWAWERGYSSTCSTQGVEPRLF